MESFVLPSRRRTTNDDERRTHTHTYTQSQRGGEKGKSPQKTKEKLNFREAQQKTRKRVKAT